MFHPWPVDEVEVGSDEELVRLVLSWATTEAEIDRFVGLL